MFKIIGADQKEYGPVTVDQINQWIIQGRVNGQTKAKTDGGEWKTLGEFPEFAAALGNRVSPGPTAAPPPTIGAPMPPVSSPAKTSSLAVCSLIFGCIGLFTCGISSVVGLILGILAMSKVKKSNGALTGHGIALAGTIVSGVFLLMLPIWAAMVLPALVKARQRAHTIQCMNNMKQLALAVRIYSSDHDDHFPPAATWCDAIRSNAPSEKVFRCPAAGENDRCDYAFNSRLSGVDEKTINPETVLIIEADDNWNANGGPELVSSKWRHGGKLTVAFADGHIETVTPERFSQLRWNP